MKLREAISKLDNYTVVNEKGLLAINGNFGNENYADFMDKEVKSTKVLEGMYQNYTRINI